jgi:hypothetical protein
MPKTKISEFSATPANNTDIDSINIAEGCAPSGINDAIRELMAQLKDFQTGAVGDSFNGPIGTSTAAAGAFTTLSASSTATLSGLTASTALALDASKNIVSVTNTGTGSNVLATSPTLVTPILGTPTSATLTNATGLPIATGVSGLGTNVATFLATPSSANLAAALTDETGSGANVFATSPTLVTPILGTPTSATLTNATGLPLTTGVTGTLPTANGGTNLTSFTANGVVYASSSSALATGSALTFDGTNLSTTGSIYLAYDQAFYFKNLSGTNRQVLAYANNTFLDGGDGSIIFRTGASPAEGMRLTSTGLGIGTSSPWTKLSVYGTGSQRIAVTSPTGGATVAALDLSPSMTAGEAASYDPQARIYAVDDNYSANIIFASKATGATANSLQTRMTLNSAGNLGLGVTPSAWSTGFKALQIGAEGALWSSTSTAATWLTRNVFLNTSSSFRYIANDYANALQIDNDGAFKFYTAASGTAGNAITFTQAMTLDASGNLMVGGTTALNTASGRGNITIDGSSNSILNFGVGGVAKSYLFQNAGNFIIANLASAGGYLGFENNGAERARIDSSGNVGIGTTSQNERLRLNSSTAGQARMSISYADSTISFYGSYSGIVGSGNATDTFLSSANVLAFGSGGTTERARIDSSGKFIVNDTSPVDTSMIGVKYDGINANGIGINDSSSASGSGLIKFLTGGTVRGSITNNANTGVLYNVTSDQRLKENIVDAPDFGSVIDSLQVRSFDWKENQTHQRAGFVAQELVTVAPEAVHQPNDTDEMMAVDYSKLVPMLVKEIQSLRQRLSAANL